MRKTTALYILILFFTCIAPQVAKANNAAAGAITYTWISDSTYKVLFKFYNDCKGNPAPDSVSLCVYNSCTNTGFSSTMYKQSGNIQNNTLPNGYEVPIACRPTKKTRCTDVNSTLPGLHEWWYVDTVTLPSRCIGWSFRVALSARNAAHNIDTGNMLVQTSFNNELSLQNSSPEFSSRPTIFVCLNQPFTLNPDATDADGDSLDFAVVNTKTANNIACPATPANINIKYHTPPINFTNNPFQTNNTFTLNKTTGQISFTSTSSVGENTFTMRVNEYRNGVYIGSVLRDMQVYVFACSTIVPLIDTYQARRFYIDSIKGGAQRDTLGPHFIACVGTQLDYYFPFRAPDTTSRFIIADNIATAIPGATISYTNQGTNKVGVHINWTPGINDGGKRSFQFTLKDTACRPPGVYLEYAWTIDVYVASGISAGNDTAICSHESIVLRPTVLGLGAGTHTWQMLPGSTGTLSCNNCDIALGKPAPTASYLLTSSASWCKSVYTDTIHVSTLSTPVTYPTFNISVSPDSNIWQWLEATFTANTTNCTTPVYQWMKNGYDITGATAATYSSTKLRDDDVISCRFSCYDSCPDPRNTISNAITIHVAMTVKEKNTGETGIISYPNPVEHFLNIDIPLLNITGQHALIITDVTGRLVVHSVLADKQNKVDVSSLSQGLYIIKINAEGKPVFFSKMFKK